MLRPAVCVMNSMNMKFIKNGNISFSKFPLRRALARLKERFIKKIKCTLYNSSLIIMLFITDVVIFLFSPGGKVLVPNSR